MIVCPKCKAENSPAGEHCVKCGSSLLPKRTIAERIVALIIGLICLAGILYLTTRMAAGFWIGLFILGGITAGAFAFALGRETIADRYEERADKYKDSDPEQAIADYTKAIELNAKSLGPVNKRARLYRKLGRREEALRDFESVHARAGRALKKEVEKEITAIRTELTQMPSPTLQMKKCRYCGESIAAEVTRCPKCGKQQ